LRRHLAQKPGANVSFPRAPCKGGAFQWVEAPPGNRLFMKANGDQLREITSLIDAGTIRPVVDRVFPFESTKEVLGYVETGRAKASSSSR
jgi:NADPH:quinone reductase-like Zn-dependent oxidoreductase